MNGRALRHGATEGGGGGGVRRIGLGAGALWHCAPRNRAITILAIDGAIWITQTAGEGDLILRRGESFTSRGEGRVVIEAITGTAEIGIRETDGKGGRERGEGVFEKMRAFARQLLAGRRAPRRESYCN